jgi:tetratricopeptide (TPR) repeat protein
MTELEGRAMELFAEVLDLSPEQQCARLKAACGSASKLRARVEELLTHHREAETIDFLRPLIPPPDVGVSDEAPPDLPDSRYQALKLLDRGGEGMVWHVHDLEFHRPLALKVMRAYRPDSPRVCRFLAAARITARLAHPSIVPVHSMGQLADGRPYFIMKFVDGKKLERLIADSDVASERLALLQIFARVCQALAFAHSKGVIHRDLKSGNIMVGEHGEVQVIDWGLAKRLGKARRGRTAPVDPSPGPDGPGAPGRTKAGAIMGTPAYMSPEQARGQIEEMDQRSDVFGLGAILCEILTSRPPYTGQDVMGQARNADLAADAYRRLETCGADADLIELAKRCLAKEPSGRPQDAGEVAKAVTTYLTDVENRKIAAEKKLAVELARAAAQRRAWWLTVGLAACAGLLLLATAVASLFKWQASAAEVARLEAEQDQLAEKLAREAEKRQNAIDKALTAAMSGDLDAAEKAIVEAEQAGASIGQVEMLRGQIALHRGQTSHARMHLQKAVEQLPKSVAARGMLAVAYAYDGDWEQYGRMIQEMEQLTPTTPEDFLFKGYAVAYLEPEQGLQMIKRAFDLRPIMGIALLLRAEVRAFVAEDKDNLDEAERAVLDAQYAKELLRNNPTVLWVSLEAHLAKAGVHEHRGERDRREAELKLAGEDADALKRFTEYPEAVVYRWLYFREVRKEEEVLEELRLASETGHVYATFCYVLTLYRRGDLEKALAVLEKNRGTYNDRLRPFVLAEIDHPNKHDWPARALKAYEDFAERSQDGAAILDTQAVLCMLGRKGDSVKASNALLKQENRFYILRREPILRCVRYRAGELSADELLQRAGRSQWNQCLAHYNIAMTKLAEGDREGAQEHFDKAVKTRAWGWGEYEMSWVFQARLADPTWPPRIPKGPAK